MDIINEGPSLNEQHKHLLNLYLTHDDIKEATWSIPENKATGLDCYNSGFYKAAWEIIGDDIVKAIHNFFDTRTFFKAWNVTAITLFPKTVCPNELGDFRPISCS